MLKVNGRDKKFVQCMTVETLLVEMDYSLFKVAVERNGVIVSRHMLSQVVLEDGDVIEVVSFVGGG